MSKIPESGGPKPEGHLKKLAWDIMLRTAVVSSYILSMVPAVLIGGLVFILVQPLSYFLAVALSVAFAIPLVCIFVGTVYVRAIQHCFAGNEVGKRDRFCEMFWAHYLQAVYLAQWVSLPFLNGSWLCSLLHRSCGAKCALDSTWLSFNIRDHQNLTVESGAVIDRCGYLVGHAHQVGRNGKDARRRSLNLKADPDEDEGGAFYLSKSSVGKGGVLHPYAIILGGGHIKNFASLDCNSHSHMEASIPKSEHWSGSPAKKLNKGRLCHLRAGTVDV
eukprot:gnl/MRDRNA2_/MRDRNA2_156308_c0_seq1.p1 gnl/MRDRNA2_/MRDRNA2_156308_c0~~gnl/MRDRNA2_/MRDRNA2_156308_c0_seq1.p1  ORF type:complete len:275 (-),score=40.78 gnl/MRDRNA2_/MRDRNA2_156308_c0_seq1:9-833(-)